MKHLPEKPKVYIVRKYIKATNAAQAIRKDKTTPVHDVWISEEWKEKQHQHLTNAIGFDDGNYTDEVDEV